MQIEGDTAIRSSSAQQPTQTQSLAEAMIERASTAFGTVDTQALAQAVLAPALAGAAGSNQLLNEVGSQLSPVQQGDLQRDISVIIDKITDAIAKFFGSIFGDSGATPAPTTAPALPSTATGSARVPGLEAIAKDPAVATAIDAAWTASNPNTPGAKVETGFWVVRDDKTGALSVVQFPSNGTNDSLTPGAVPSIDGKTTVAFFHTHPNTTGEGYISGPSPADQRFADANGIPGIIRSHDGMYYFNNK